MCEVDGCERPLPPRGNKCNRHRTRRILAKCGSCSREFMADRADRKYCSSACYDTARAPQVARCLDCGVSIAATSTRCRSCAPRNTWADRPSPNKGELVKVTCEACGSVRELCPAHAKGARACSRKCAYDLRRRVTGEAHPLFKTKVVIVCGFCGRHFEAKPSEANRKRYCSRECVGSASIRMQGGRSSSLEESVAAHLDSLGVAYERQARVRRFLVDFRIGDLIVEADGVYWHSRPKVIERDARKNAAIEAEGMRLVRLTEAQIRAGDFQSLEVALDAA